MSSKIRLGISSCLYGRKVRYDGRDKLDTFLRDELGRRVRWYPVCPEVECGLPVPREAMRLEQTHVGIRLMTIQTRRDLTAQMQAWIRKTLDELSGKKLRGFVFKSRSPSSAMRDADIFTPEGSLVGQQAGLFAAAFMEHFPLLPVEDELGLRDLERRAVFFGRIFSD